MRSLNVSAEPVKRAELIFRRLVSAGPEFVLAWLSFSSARDVLAGNPVDGYVLGVVFIELLGLTWIRFALLRRDGDGMLSSLLGLGKSALALFSLVLQAVFGLLALIVILAVDAELFLLLAIAAFRRSLWIWSWDLSHVHNRIELKAHYRRLRYAHVFALAMAGLCSVVLYLLLDLTDPVLGDAFYMMGLAGYFMTLGIYQLAGHMPQVDEKETDAAEPVSRRTIPLPDIDGIMDTFKREWLTFLPDILILWVILSLAQAVMDPDLFTAFLPLIVSAAALVLLSSAAISLGSSRESPMGHAWARRGPCLYVAGAINLLVLLLFGLSMPLVAGLLGLDIGADEPIGNTAFMSAMLGVALLLLSMMIRLWPALVLPLLMEKEDIPPPIPDLLKLAWQLTRGPDGFVRAGAAPLLILTPILLLSLPGGPWGIAGLCINYLVLAPLAAVVMVERTLVMLQVKGDIPIRDRAAADELVEREYQLEAAGGGAVPVPIPVPTGGPGAEDLDAAPAPDRVSPEHRLFNAIWAGDTREVVECLDSGVSVDAVRDDDPAIIHAANRGYGDIVRLLLDHGANAHAPNRFATSLLHECVGAGLPSLVSDLVDRYDFDVNATDSNGATPLMRAVLRANFEVAELLLERGADLLVQDVNGRDALVYLVSSVSAFRGDGGSARPDADAFLVRLLQAQTDLSPDNAALQVAVDEAAGRGLSSVLQRLHEHGVDLTRSSAGVTAIQRAAANGHRETVQALLRMGVPVDIHAAILAGDRQGVAGMLEREPALANARPGSGTQAAIKPPIYQAMAAGDAELVKLLIEQGADPDAASPGWLYFLARHMHDGEIAQMMVDRGADIECVDGDGNTALNIAARHNNLPVARVLLAAGADPNARTERGYFVRAWAKEPEMDALIERYGGRYEGGPY